ncbi:hypothetical protein [Ekhidna sp.]|uniref:hypothetical protein n=1 Tax=Ekhidna sp. TaxID=2608089 RepID=UPI003517C839
MIRLVIAIILYTTLQQLAAQGYSVGYSAIEVIDSLRQEQSPSNFLRKSPETRFRPLLIHIWYPALSDGNLQAMSHWNYQLIKQEFQERKRLNQSQKNALLFRQKPNLDWEYTRRLALFGVSPKVLSNRSWSIPGNAESIILAERF